MEKHERSRTLEAGLYAEISWLMSDQTRVLADMLVIRAERLMFEGMSCSDRTTRVFRADNE